MNKTKCAFIILGLLIIILISGCSSSGKPDSSNQAYPTVVYFPVQKEPQQPVPALGRDGTTLRLYKGYLRVDSDNPIGDLLIWPPGYSVKIENDVVEVFDKEGKFVAKVGDKIDVGGGPAVTKEIVKIYTGKSLPKDCEGPYWLALGINQSSGSTP